ncbi:MAG: MFS transporter [Bacteroidota bacterium]|nr:MFS transporter [Bacteroidota bacterium]OCW93238.1 MFS transporter [Macellibacteroides sp. HH-ZS]
MVQTNQYKGNDKLLFGIILGVLAFWFFAQTTLNINVVMSEELQMNTSMMNIAVSITALFSGIFIVVFGGIADRFGRVKVIKIGFFFSIFGSLLVGITPIGPLATPVLIAGRILQGLSGACIMPASLALVKTYWDGTGRQRAVSLWSMGSWGGSGFCALFGGLMAQNVGWRYIFFASAIVSIIGLLLINGTPESKAVQTNSTRKFDFAGIFTFMIAMIALQIFVSKGSDLGWTSSVSLLLILVTLVFSIAFITIENRISEAFIDFRLFKNSIYTGATLSNFLLNGVTGMLIVSLMLMQVGGNLSAQEVGLLTLGYAIAILAFIRVGEKLLQRFGSRKPMIWGCIIVGVAIALLMSTNVMTGTYKLLAVFAYTLFGVGLAFYATPSTDAALSNLPDSQAGSGSGIYKMASSLGAAFGVAISAGIFTGLSGAEIDWLNQVITFAGRQDNLSIRQAAIIALAFNLLLVVIAIVTILFSIPKETGKIIKSK